MQQCDGFIERIDGDDVVLRITYDGDRSGIATVPRRRFPSSDRARLVDGAYIECAIDHTLLVTDVRLKDVPSWTQEEIDAAKRRAADRSASLRVE